jgi:hypothetical protein
MNEQLSKNASADAAISTAPPSTPVFAISQNMQSFAQNLPEAVPHQVLDLTKGAMWIEQPPAGSAVARGVIPIVCVGTNPVPHSITGHATASVSEHTTAAVTSLTAVYSAGTVPLPNATNAQSVSISDPAMRWFVSVDGLKSIVQRISAQLTRCSIPP